MKCFMYESSFPEYRLSTDPDARGEPVDLPDDLFERFQAASREHSIATADLLLHLRRKEALAWPTRPPSAAAWTASTSTTGLSAKSGTGSTSASTPRAASSTAPSTARGGTNMELREAVRQAVVLVDTLPPAEGEVVKTLLIGLKAQEIAQNEAGKSVSAMLRNLEAAGC